MQDAITYELPNIVDIEKRNAGFGVQMRGDDSRASVYGVIDAPGPLEAVSIAMFAARTAILYSGQEDNFDVANAVLRVAPADQAELIYGRTEPWVSPPSSWPDGS